MKDRIIEIDIEIDALDKEKKNFARRINYKINKLKQERSGLVEVLNSDVEIKAATEEIKALEAGKDFQSPCDLIKKRFNIKPEPFELVREQANYHLFLNNNWVEIPFLDLVPGNFFRVWLDGKAKQIRGGKTFEVVSLPYANHQHRHTIRVKHPDLPIRSIKEEIALRLKAGESL